MQNVTDMLDKLTSESKQLIKEHSLEVFPIESCGVVVSSNSGQRVLKAKNIFNSENKFLIDNSVFNDVKYDEKTIAVYHSHTKDGFEDFSEEDIAVSEKIKIDFILYNVVSDTFKNYSPSIKKVPLIGRPFFAPFFTCVTLIEDYYTEFLNINLKIPESEIHKVFYKFISSPNPELLKYFKKLDEENAPEAEYLLNAFKNSGFTQVSNPKSHDIFVVKMQNFLPNSYTHCGILDTRDTFIESRRNKPKSTQESISELYKDLVKDVVFLRYKTLL